MPDKIFVDTNILVYAHDIEAGTKHKTAKDKIAEIWDQQSGVLSLQVLQEFYVTVTQKIPKPVDFKIARGLLEKYGYWEVVTLETADLLTAIDLQKRHHFSFWDALIVQSALKADCGILLTEDFQDGFRVNGLTIKNLFVSNG